MIERIAYICEYCNKHRPMKKSVYLTEAAARGHEYTCCYNPDRRTCLTCEHNIYVNHVNICEIGKNYFYNHMTEKERSESCNYPIKARIMFGCEHWQGKTTEVYL